MLFFRKLRRDWWVRRAVANGSRLRDLQAARNVYGYYDLDGAIESRQRLQRSLLNKLKEN